jgi:Cu(I)/Ag(I) efflux system membrane fusion protein
MRTLGLLLCTACGSGAATPPVVRDYLAVGSALAGDRVEVGSDVPAADPGLEGVLAGRARLGTGDLAGAREAYRDMSEDLIGYLRARPEQRADLVVVHCPMAFGGKGGRWVQARGQVANPYEGSRMLRCGDVLAWDAVGQAP